MLIGCVSSKFESAVNEHQGQWWIQANRECL